MRTEDNVPDLPVSQDRFFQEFLRFVRANDLIPPGSRVLVSVSGGLDSTVLAQIMARARRVLKIEVEFAHVDHRTRGVTSEREGAWVKVLGDRLSVKTHQLQLDVLGEEMSQMELRDLRRILLKDKAGELGADFIATAHHADDNAETFLMRAISGTGVQGLAGIAPKEGFWIRPLLWAHRRDLEDYARTFRFGWVEDPSNERGVYLRNQLRRSAIPLLEQLRTGATRNLARAAERILEEEREWDAWIEAQLDGPVDSLPRAWVERWPDPLQRRIFKVWLKRLGLDPEPKLIEALMGGEEMVHREGSFLRRSDLYVFLSERDFGSRFRAPIKVELGKKIELGASTAWSFMPQAPERFKRIPLGIYLMFRPPELKSNPGTILFAWDKLPWPLQIRARKTTDAGAPLDRILAKAKIPRPFWAEWPVLVGRGKSNAATQDSEADRVVGLVGLGALPEYQLNGVGRCVSAECFFEERLKAVSPS